jgi:beta-N-acetylhexosaminidase
MLCVRAVKLIGLGFLMALGMLPRGFSQSKSCVAFENVRGDWARQTLESLSLEEKIGQLFMVAAYTYPGQQNRALVEYFIRKYGVGGVMCMKGTPYRQVELVNDLQRLSRLPLLISQDAEWGVSMRLGNDSAWRMPNAMTLGALPDGAKTDSLLYQVGAEMARQCRAVGVHVNFAPVVDVNNNARNPVINERSFGEDKFEVMRRARLVMQGLQANGVIACAKHFPGHGNTSIDSHLDMPVQQQSLEAMDTLELLPFRDQIAEGVMGVMTAHLYLPALETRPNVPASLSYKVVTSLLRQQMGFEGLIFSDALNMLGVAKYYPPGEMELRALEAGADVLLFTEELGLSLTAIREAVFSGRISEARIDSSVLKILKAKEWLGLHKMRLTEEVNLSHKLRSDAGGELRSECYREAVTLARNDDGILPLKTTRGKRFACLQVGREDPTPYYEMLARHIDVDLVTATRTPADEEQDSLLERLTGYDVVLVALQNLNRRPSSQFGISNWTLDMICELQKCGVRVVTTVFGNPYGLTYLPEVPVLVCGFEENEHTAEAAAEIILGARLPKGHLPVTPEGRPIFPVVVPAYATRLGIGTSQTAGLDANVLSQIDTLINGAIQRRATPGCVLMVSRGMEVAYAKGYGYTDYENHIATNPYRTRYDIASVTKIAATTLAVMRLFEQGRLDLDGHLGHYLLDVPANKKRFRIRQLLTHSSGLPGFVPFWQNTVHNGTRDTSIYANRFSEAYPIQIGQALYLRAGVPDSVYKWILEQPVKPHQGYVYSDLGMILMAEVVEKITGQTLEQYVHEQFYEPLSLAQTCFNPALKGVPLQETPPTVLDQKFRFQPVMGYVNDECAALMGGVAGHAGVFSTAWDLTKLMTMLKNGGTYGGVQYFKPETIKLFTAYAGVGRRGLGFDKPEPDPKQSGPTASAASPVTFGHLGFTGTCVWADPTNDLVYVLLSNRTYPDPENNAFVQSAIRKSVMELLYQAIGVKPPVVEAAPNTH